MKEITFYYTGDSFPAISVTGRSCALNCKHCNRRMLENLYSAKSNEELLKLAKNFSKKNARGLLLTGGCDGEARVPIYRFYEAIKRIKKETNLIVLAHTGIIDYDTAKLLKEAGLDGVSLDIVASEEVTESIYGIKIPKEKYRESLLALKKAGIKVISPHVCVGLYYGKLSHELDSLDLISCIAPTEIIIIALMPLKGTPMENVKVKPNSVVKIIEEARKRFPKTRIILGCAHSVGEDRALIEELVINKVNGIAMPTPRVEKLAERLNFKIYRQGTCCALPLFEGDSLG